MTDSIGPTLIQSVFQDLVVWRQDLQDTLALDFLNLSYLIEQEGYSILFEHLPKLGKAFDKALSSGKIYYPKSPLYTDRLRVFSVLFSEVFDENDDVRVGADPNMILFIRQFCCMFKKVEGMCPPEAIIAAVREYHAIEDQMRSPTLSWIEDELSAQPVSFLDEDSVAPKKLIQLFEQVADYISSSFPVLDSYSIIPRHGPGAVSDRKTGYDKFGFPYWPRKLDFLFPYDSFATHNLLFESDVNYVNHEHPAKLLAVPKTPLKPRLIASEPTYYQYIQQGILVWIRENLPFQLRQCMNFKDQAPSQQRVKEGSSDGSIISMDLSNASDNMSLWCVERFFRKNRSMLEAFHAARSRWLFDGITENPKYRILKKFAAQGAAFTFPVQTIIYSSICIASYLFEHKKRVNRKNIMEASRAVRIFGDDIIIPNVCLDSTSLILNHLQFKINMGKTHISGWFRESCGMDAYKGYNVTPVYINSLKLERSADSLSSWVDMSNNAHKAGFFFLSRCIMSIIHNMYGTKFIPITKDDVGGKTFFSFGPDLYPTRRFNKKLHVMESRMYVTRTRKTKGERCTDSNLLQFFVERWRDPTKVREDLKYGRANPTPFWEAGFTRRIRTSLEVRWVPTKSGRNRAPTK